MLCTRCHEREAREMSPEKRARCEELFGAPWPFPEGLCGRCLARQFKEDPELRARLRTLSNSARAKVFAMIGADVRRGVNSVLDVADRLADRLRDAFK